MFAQAPVVPPVSPKTALQGTLEVKTSISTTPRQIAIQTAKEHHLNVGRFLAVIECESQWNERARGDYKNGQPTSFGLAQLHYPERDWGITIEQAYDPKISLEIMATSWENGDASRWSCY